MKSLFTNGNNLPAFKQAASELEKSLNEILAYELTAFLDCEPYQRTDKENSETGSIKGSWTRSMVLLHFEFLETDSVNSLLLLSLNIEDETFQRKPPFLIFLKKD